MYKWPKLGFSLKIMVACKKLGLKVATFHAVM